MGIYLKITCFLLLVQTAHLALPEDSTDSPGRTIDKIWLRDLVDRPNKSQNQTSVEDNGPGIGSGIDESSGRPLGSGIQLEEDDYVSNQEEETQQTSDETVAASFTALPTTNTGGKAELTNTAVYSSVSPANESKTNTSVEGDHFYKSTTLANSATSANPAPSANLTTTSANSTATSANSTVTLANPTTNEMITQISTSFPELSNHTEFVIPNITTERNSVHESITEPNTVTVLINRTQSKTAATTEDANGKEGSSSPTMFSSETTEKMPVKTTTAAPTTAKEANLTDKNGASGGNAERGFASDLQMNQRHRAWGAVLGTAVAVTCVGLVVYLIKKKKTRKGFSHRKLIEEFPTDPVLRLDNSEPLNLNYAGSAYYNPGLQGDNIQMTDFPEDHRN
ncbi:mucin-15 isoform X3 [Thalassophryne amazonica]|uniref:mucin-15 isoform X3 n=1 Tax=Thalassophryne amazonica TaxID=390379 RepID=UPI0014719271|nr:mucin-15 isoform X3 [Thalassophryne amazonica]